MKTQTAHENDRKKSSFKKVLWTWAGPDLCRLGSELKPKKKQLLVSLDCTLGTKVLVYSRVGEEGGVGETRTSFIRALQEARSE